MPGGALPHSSSRSEAFESLSIVGVRSGGKRPLPEVLRDDRAHAEAQQVKRLAFIQHLSEEGLSKS